MAETSDITAFGSFRLQIDAKALGPKLGPKMKDVLAATKSGAWKIVGERAEIGGAVLEKGDSVYFNPTHPHGQRCASDTPASFVTIIAE